MKFLVVLILLFGSINAIAANVESTTIKRLMVDRNYGDIVHVNLHNRQNTPIECHDNATWEYVLDISDSVGEKMYSALLALYASQKTAKFVGMDNCNISPHNNTETLRRIELK